MYAWQRAKEVWMRDHPEPGGFEQLLGQYVAQGGYVWSSPEEFILAAPVRIEPEASRIIHSDDDADTWFVHLAALTAGAAVASSEGRRPFEAIWRFLTRAPYQLPYVAWHRRTSIRLHRYSWDDLERHCHLDP